MRKLIIATMLLGIVFCIGCDKAEEPRPDAIKIPLQDGHTKEFIGNMYICYSETYDYYDTTNHPDEPYGYNAWISIYTAEYYDFDHARIAWGICPTVPCLDIVCDDHEWSNPQAPLAYLADTDLGDRDCNVDWSYTQFMSWSVIHQIWIEDCDENWNDESNPYMCTFIIWTDESSISLSDFEGGADLYQGGEWLCNPYLEPCGQ